MSTSFPQTLLILLIILIIIFVAARLLVRSVSCLFNVFIGFIAIAAVLFLIGFLIQLTQ